MWGLWSRVHSEGFDCAVLVPVPRLCEQGAQSHQYVRIVTFFCNRTTLVHFFSRRPSYFFRVASSKLAEILPSSLNAAAVFVAPITPRYATMALLLSAWH